MPLLASSPGPSTWSRYFRPELVVLSLGGSFFSSWPVAAPEINNANNSAAIPFFITPPKMRTLLHIRGALDYRLCSFQGDENFESGGPAVAGAHRAFAGFDAGADNGQSEPHAAGFSIARSLRPEEGREDIFQNFFGHAGS